MADATEENAINVYTDGSSYQGPRRGGMGILFVVIDDAGKEVVYEEQAVGYKGANNQQMELQACIEALKILSGRHSPLDPREYRKVLVKTDSMYLVENFTHAKFTWPKSRWHTRDGTPVANTAQWKELVKLAVSLPRVELRWVKGHKTSTYNRRADKLAKGSAKGYLKQPLTVTSVRRKKSSKQVERGSVVLSGQMLTIRIVVVEHLKEQRVWKYKYEVMSKRSPFFGNVDVAYSGHIMRDGHTYRVRFGTDTKNPRIEKLFGEVEAKPKADT